MGLHEVDVPLCVGTDTDGNPCIKNTAPTDNPQGLSLFKLSDFVSNSPLNLTVLKITHCDISKLPNSLGDLNLRQLILNHNKLKEIPSCLFSGLASLELLDLSHNQLTEFDVQPACSGNIAILRLSWNDIKNFPYWILSTPCPKLREVYYSHNNVTGLDDSRELTIQKLHMCNCTLLDVDFKFLKKIKTLEVLDIGNETDLHANCIKDRDNRFKDVNNLCERHKWKKLLVLKLNNLQLSIIPRDIFFLTSLVELHLVNCSLNWIPEDVQYLENLQVLDVSHNSICSLPVFLTSLPHLCIVKAPDNLIDLVGDFSQNLQILDLYENRLDNFKFDVSRFTHIDLEKNVLHTPDLQDSDIYHEKVASFREKFNLDRSYGPIPPPPEFEDTSADESKDMSEEDYDSCEEKGEGCANSTLYLDIECWDEEKPRKNCVEGNPEATPSDNEWDGKEDIKARNKKKKIQTETVFDADEDWIFADVEEE